MKCMAAIICLLACWIGPAIAAEPFAEGSIATKGTIVAGQQIQLEVTVFAPNFFTSAPQFPLFDLPNAIVTLPDIRAQNLNRTVDGQQFSGIRRIYLIIPQVAGDYTLPPAAISLSYAATPGQSTAAAVTIPSAKFTAAAVPGPVDARILVATDVGLSQSLDRNPAELKVGDSLVRTVSLFAEDTQAMMLPQPKFEAPKGVALYASTSKLEDNITDNGGNPDSKRTDRVTYVAGQEGTFSLPALTIDWFDTDNARIEQARLEPLVLSVKAAPATATAIAPDVPKESSTESGRPLMRTILMGSAVLLAAALLGALGWRAIPRMLRWMDAREKMMEQSEPARFRQLYLALNSDDAKAAYVALEAWTGSAGYQNIAEWSSATGDAKIGMALGAFEADLFRTPALETSRLHMNTLASAILTWRGGQSPRTDKPRDENSALPALNP